MVTMMSTKMTKGGQTTVPKEIRRSLGIADNARVYWSFDGTRAWVSAHPTTPLEITSASDFYGRLEEAEAAIAAGQTRDAGIVSSELRQKYSLA